MAKASDLLPSEILNSPDYTIESDVPTDGFMGTFTLRSKYGDFICEGREMLYVRISEVEALKELEKVSKTKEFFKAMGGAVAEPAVAAEKIVTQPVRSAENVPLGIAHLLKDIGGGFVDTGKAVTKIGQPKEKGPKPPPTREDPLGYNKLRNEWAAKLAVDPYTTNRVLAVKLNHLATIGFGTNKATSVGMGFELGGLGVIGEYVSYLPDADKHLLTRPPEDVAAENARRLKKLGIDKRDFKPLLENKWFTPTLQTRYVNALVKLGNLSGLVNAMPPAANASSEVEARFLCGCLEILDRYNADAAPLNELSIYAGLPAATAADGTLVVGMHVDLISWTETVSGFAAVHPANQKAVLCTNGLLTQHAQEGFKAEGWQVIQAQGLKR